MDAEAYADLLPWLVFVVVERKTGLGLGWAGGCAAVGAAALGLSAYWRGRPAPVARLGVVLFAVLGLSDLVHPSWSSHIADTRAIAALVLGLAAFASLRSTPMSMAYTVAHVPPAVRDDWRFRRVNGEITLSWGAGAVLATASYACADVSHSAVGLTFLNWVVPMAIAASTLVWAAHRWDRFYHEVPGAAMAGRVAERAMPTDLGTWVETHDAVIRQLPRSGQE